MTDATASRSKQSGNSRYVGGALAPAGFSWALFEFARNPYFMLIVTYVFPPYFQLHIVGNEVEGQAAVFEATTWAGIIGALTAPVLGAMMDRGGARKPLMALFIAMIAVSGASLWFSVWGTTDATGVFHPPTTGLGAAGTMACLVLGFVGYTYSELMHNAMLGSSGRPASLSQISGAGIGLGQLSSAICLIALVVVAIAVGSLGTEEGGFVLQRGAGPFVAVWLIVFVAPFFLFVPDGKPEGGSWRRAAREVLSYKGKFNPLGAIFGCFAYIAGLFRAYPETMKYLLACLIFKDAITALLAGGGVYSSGVLKWDVREMGLYGIWASIFGVIGGLWLAGWLDRMLGPRRAIILQLSLLCLAVVAALGVTHETIFYGLLEAKPLYNGDVFNTTSDLAYLIIVALLAALAAANISAARYMMVTLAPPGRTSEFFGLFAMSSTATVWLGPLLSQWATRAFNDQRIGFAPILVLLLIGVGLMCTLKKTTGAKAGAEPPSGEAT